ncbi:hypothetical protein MBLNU459_g5996t1 [Dothideomycetes sp. NU459]
MTTVLRNRRRKQLTAPSMDLSKPTTPLALDILDKATIDPQANSPLFSTIPKEVRDLVFEYALLAYPDPNRPYSNNEQYARPGVVGHPRIATELLATCRAVYVECYQLPITLNPLIVFFDGHFGNIPPHARGGFSNLRKLAPWQWAALRMIDISLQQTHLETSSTVAEAARIIHAKARFEGAMVTSDYTSRVGCIKPLEANQSSPSTFVPTRLSGLQLPSADPTILRRIDKLTLRLGRTEWWTWTDSPFSPGSGHLGIDPSGGGERCTQQMLASAEDRRQGRWSGWPNEECWGAQIAEFKGLICLEMVLETFAAKKAQLDAVIGCAKTWTFPMEKGYELRYDGDLEATAWTGVDDYGYERRIPWLTSRNGTSPNPRAVLGVRTSPATTVGSSTPQSLQQGIPDGRLFEVRTIRFNRRRILS